MSERDPKVLSEIDQAAARMVHDLFDHGVEHTVGDLRSALAEGLYDAVAGFAERLSQPRGCDHLDGPYRHILEQRQAVVDLHSPERTGEDNADEACGHCDVPYPCPTIRALTDAALRQALPRETGGQS